jgi:hypothetical protein
MKPKAQNEHDDGLLEYLEDIIGTAKYKQPIEDGAKDVEALNEVCLEKSNRVAIVAKEKANLEVCPPVKEGKLMGRIKKGLHCRISGMKMSWLESNLRYTNSTSPNAETTFKSLQKSSYRTPLPNRQS